MADKEGSGDSVNSFGASTLYVDSIKCMVESLGVGTLEDEAAKQLAEDVTLRLKLVLQDAVKFMHHANRSTLTTQDFDHSLKIKNLEPFYGMQDGDAVPFKFASGGGRELHFIEEKEAEIEAFIGTPVPSHRAPFEVRLTTHWLAIDGIQPEIPENPRFRSLKGSKDQADPSKVSGRGSGTKGSGPLSPAVGKPIKFKPFEQVMVKQLPKSELSKEQQMYFKVITEACVGSDTAKRSEAWQSIANDPGLQNMLPRLCTFVSESVRVNVIDCHLALLIYLMHMVRGLLNNQSLYLDPFLHEIIPSVATCVLTKQLCIRPESDNHWALRDFAARLIGQICKNYSTPHNNIQPRIIAVMENTITGCRAPLSTLYGAVAALCELGDEIIKKVIIPNLKDIGNRLEVNSLSEKHLPENKCTKNYFRLLIQKYVAPVLCASRRPPDILEEYKALYGFLGSSLYVCVQNLRTRGPKPAIIFK